MTDQSGFQIDGVFYPAAQGIKIKDGPIIRALTGKNVDEVVRLSEEDDGGWDAAVTGIALAIRRAHPDWDDDTLLAFIGEIDLTTVAPVGNDARPPAVAPASRSAEQSGGSTSTPERIVEVHV